MIIKFINALLIVTVLVSASVLYSLEQNKRAVARDILRTDADIVEEKENLKLLTAEWSSLVRPDRIRSLSAAHTTLQAVNATQFATIGKLSLRLPAHPFVNLEPEAQDSIGAALQGLEEKLQ
jgi:hypothetical protein